MEHEDQEVKLEELKAKLRLKVKQYHKKDEALARIKTEYKMVEQEINILLKKIDRLSEKLYGRVYDWKKNKLEENEDE